MIVFSLKKPAEFKIIHSVILRSFVYLNVDLDNLWNYELEFGSPPLGNSDILFTEAMPKMLEIFAKHRAHATFFVVGKDLELESCQKFCKEAALQGHEIANHTYSHLGNIQKLSFTEKEKEIVKCHELIEKHTGILPVGFRGPGYYIDQDIIQILLRENYLYDSSVLPSFMNFFMGFYILLRTGRVIDKNFGRKRWMFATQNITKICSKLDSENFLYELPVTTAPFLRIPIHTTYLYMFGTKYFEWCLPRLRQQAHGVYLFHGVDTLDYQQDENLSKNLLPLRKQIDERLRLLEWILIQFQQPYFVTNREGLSRLDSTQIPKSKLIFA